MTSNMKAWTAVGISLLLAIGATIPVQADEVEPCAAPGAWLISPDDGQVVVQTQVGGATVPGTPLQGVFVSTTGVLEVEIGHDCLTVLEFYVDKVEVDGTTTMIHHTLWHGEELGCHKGTLTDSVEIGLDGGEYLLGLGWRDCFREDGGEQRRTAGFDPPLPIGSAAADEIEPCAEPAAWFISPDDGQVVVQTQVGSATLPGTPLQGVFVSTTGEIEVEIGIDCLRTLELFVDKVEVDGSTTEIHHAVWPVLHCELDTLTDTVTIGLDAGEYIFEVAYRDCDGHEGGDRRPTVGFDPPLPL